MWSKWVNEMKFALFGNTLDEPTAKSIELLTGLLSHYGDEVIHGISDNVDMVISMGGDGTFLRAARQVGASGVPIVGINTGHLGFLADVHLDEMAEFVACLHRSQYEIRERSVLQAEIYPLGCCSDPEITFALNEVAVTKHDSASMISICASVSGELLTTYRSDGLLVVTPTGSTAYSLSAGGPIIHPQSEVFLLNAVAPHSLNMRPIIISDDKEIVLSVDSRSGRFLIAVDGQSQSYETGTRISLRKAPFKIKVVKQVGNTWFHTLREKMMWGIR